MLGEKIKEYRLKKGLSQEELARALGVVRQTVSKWEKELSLPDSQMLVEIAAVLDTTPAELLDTQEEQPAKETRSRRFKVWEIVLLALGSPIWISLLIAALAVAVSLYASLWAVLISLWAVFGSLVGCAVGGVAFGNVLAFTGHLLPGIALVGAGLTCAGLSIAAFLGCKSATKYVVVWTCKLWKCIIGFFKKENINE